MRFGTDNKVIVQSLKVNEAEAFIKFLESEIIRHKIDIQEAEALIKEVKDMYRL